MLYIELNMVLNQKTAFLSLASFLEGGMGFVVIY